MWGGYFSRGRYKYCLLPMRFFTVFSEKHPSYNIDSRRMAVECDLKGMLTLMILRIWLSCCCYVFVTVAATAVFTKIKGSQIKWIVISCLWKRPVIISVIISVLIEIQIEDISFCISSKGVQDISFLLCLYWINRICFSETWVFAYSFKIILLWVKACKENLLSGKRWC